MLPCTSIAALLVSAGVVSASEDEGVLVVDLLEGASDPALVAGSPAFWRSEGEIALLEDQGGPGFRLARGARIAQPLPAYGPLATGVRIGGEVRGSVRVLVREDGGEELASLTFGADGWTDFELTFDERRPQPRLELVFEAAEGEGGVRALFAEVPFPDPKPDAFEAELVATLERLYRPWFEHALDDVGPRSTAFVARHFDVDDGSHGPTFTATSLHPLWIQLLALQRVDAEVLGDVASTWERALAHFVRDYLELGLHPETGLPRLVDPSTDRGHDERFVEIALPLRFLIDAADHGPEELRERADAAARRIGELVLERGRLPDGRIAAAYRPSDGMPGAAPPPLRRLDVAAELGRLGLATDDVRYLDAAREAALELEYALHWGVTPERIDPGFDDDFGHYGDRSVRLWSAFPDEPIFARIATSGADVFTPALAELLQRGGYVAADQTRGWEVLACIAELDSARAPAVRELLFTAARAHLRGQQGPEGAWTDVTMRRFSPVSDLPVGDTEGIPQNLLEGLALLHDARFGLEPRRQRIVRAFFCAVLRSSLERYGGELGLFEGPRRRSGVLNPAVGSLRLTGGVAKLLERL